MQVSLKLEAIIIASLAFIGILVGSLVWYEHGARAAEAAHLEDIKRTTDAEVAGLKAQADAAEKVALQTNTAITTQLAQQNAALQTVFNSLSVQLAASKVHETQQVAAVQTMPIAEIVKLLKTELGSAATYNPATDTITGIDPATLRKTQTSIVELDSCKQQSVILNSQVSNCQQQQTGNAEIIATQKQSIEELAKVSAFKDQILEQRDIEHKAELKVVRGTLFQRVVSTAGKIGLGAAIGAAAGYAAARR